MRRKTKHSLICFDLETCDVGHKGVLGMCVCVCVCVCVRAWLAIRFCTSVELPLESAVGVGLSLGREGFCLGRNFLKVCINGRSPFVAMPSPMGEGDPTTPS